MEQPRIRHTAVACQRLPQRLAGLEIGELDGQRAKAVRDEFAVSPGQQLRQHHAVLTRSVQQLAVEQRQE